MRNSEKQGRNRSHHIKLCKTKTILAVSISYSAHKRRKVHLSACSYSCKIWKAKYLRLKFSIHKHVLQYEIREYSGEHRHQALNGIWRKLYLTIINFMIVILTLLSILKAPKYLWQRKKASFPINLC